MLIAGGDAIGRVLRSLHTLKRRWDGARRRTAGPQSGHNITHRTERYQKLTGALALARAEAAIHATIHRFVRRGI